MLKIPRDERRPVPADWPSISDVAHRILAVRRDKDFGALARGELQHYIRHDVLIAAWGDFRQGNIHYDLLTADPGVTSINVDAGAIAPVLHELFQAWVVNGGQPLRMDVTGYADAWGRGGLVAGAVTAMSKMGTVLLHGILDQRRRHDCLYAFFGTATARARDDSNALKLLVPYLDVALRQLDIPPSLSAVPAGSPASAAVSGDEQPAALSEREAEIMSWVALGKTNVEIGNILNLSSFTIKNHMQRIFKKLDVFNRAQAVSVFKSRHGPVS